MATARIVWTVLVIALPCAEVRAEPVHHGLTLNASVGGGVLRPGKPAEFNDAAGNVPGIVGDIGVGGWIGPRTSLAGQVTIGPYSQTGHWTVDRGMGPQLVDARATVVTALVGPELQYWAADSWWLGGGAGLAILRSVGSSDAYVSGNGVWGRLRAGYAIGGADNRLNIAFDLTAWSGGSTNSLDGYSGGESAAGQSVLILLGYQRL
jgi:hypothetical protein